MGISVSKILFRRVFCFSITPNLNIESITIHPRTWGIETIKQKTMETMEKEHRERMIEMAILL